MIDEHGKYYPSGPWWKPLVVLLQAIAIACGVYGIMFMLVVVENNRSLTATVEGLSRYVTHERDSLEAELREAKAFEAFTVDAVERGALTDELLSMLERAAGDDG